jgi:hypothetical protein
MTTTYTLATPENVFLVHEQTPKNTMYVVASDADEEKDKSFSEKANCFDFKNPTCPMILPRTIVAIVVCIPTFVVCGLWCGVLPLFADCDYYNTEDEKKEQRIRWWKDTKKISVMFGNICNV